MYQLTAEGRKYLKEGLPELNLIKEVSKRELSFGEAKKLENFNIALQWAKKNHWISIEDGKIYLTDKGKNALKEKYDLSELLKKAEKEELGDDDLQVLIKRNLIKKVTEKEREVKKLAGRQVQNLTSDLLRTGYWKKVKFKPYNVEASGKKIYLGKKHPLQATIERIKEVFIEMGFKEMHGPLVEVAFWNMDSMFIPQDHPAREIQDTFYLSETGELPDKDIVEKVKEVQENGGPTGSKGWRIKWDPEIAKQLLLRTHTTAVTYRTFWRGIEMPCKYFCVGRVFRNEASDATHLPEFHQAEGFIAAEDLTLRSLMGFVKEFYSKFGIDEVKFKFTYNPYTEPSLEAFGYSKTLGRWIELINSGIFRPESLYPYGIKVPVIAWGLAVERLAMFIFEKKSIKEILGPACDLKDLRNYDILKIEKW
ncbi:MAG: hypothetical protein B6D55_07010 [Candidatus Omnitrophica bacterium 4484_70.2]|nr:MAG: hypothetical protein B6D55_07010 [Candidatus Omnitrophica bacterium 4484_70.2]